MPTQFEYPDQGWSTGNMRKVGDAASAFADSPVVDTMERLHKSQKKAQGIKSLTEEQWANWQQQFPQGQMIEANHPQLAEVGKTHDLYSIPNQYEKYLFMHPKGGQGDANSPRR